MAQNTFINVRSQAFPYTSVPRIRARLVRTLAVPALAIQFAAVLARVVAERAPAFALALGRSAFAAVARALVHRLHRASAPVECTLHERVRTLRRSGRGAVRRPPGRWSNREGTSLLLLIVVVRVVWRVRIAGVRWWVRVAVGSIGVGAFATHITGASVTVRRRCIRVRSPTVRLPCVGVRIGRILSGRQSDRYNRAK